MYSFAPDQSVASSPAWGRIMARREIEDAMSTLQETRATLVSLVDASCWRSEGFRALNELLARLRDDTGREIGDLEVRQWELGAGGAR